MYELKCPSCGQVAGLPFVRVGALVPCALCGEVYQVTEARVRRKVEPVSMKVTDPVAPLQLKGADRDHPGEQGPMIRSSGDGAGKRAAPPTPKISPPRAEQTTPGLGRIAATAKARYHRRKARAVLLLLGGLVLALVFLGVSLWSVLWRLDSPGPSAESAAPGAARFGQTAPLPTTGRQGGNRPTSADPLGPVLPAQPLAAEPWQPVRQPFRIQGRDGSSIRLAHEQRHPRGATEHYVATVLADTTGIVGEAVVTLSLVDRGGIEVARTGVPVALVSARRPQRIRVPLPDGFDGTDVEVAWQARTVQPMAAGVYIDEAAVVDPQGQGPHTTVGIRAVNRSDGLLHKLVFILTAADARSQPLGRWRVELADKVAAGGRVSFRAATPLDLSWEVQKWFVEAAGQPPPAATSLSRP